jgi:hypothetical protein
LTLTGADRAIIYDPSWNPAEDSQAVDRCYRIGQTKAVTVFRFITAGSVEEKMYEKQVHKDGIRRAVMTSAGSATTRYFDKDGLKKLFTLGPKGNCEFLERLKERGLASAADMSKSTIGSHLDIIGVSSHDVLYDSNALITITDNAVRDDRNENPFSIAYQAPPPTHYEKSQAASTTTRKSTNAMGRSQRALLREGRKAKPKTTKNVEVEKGNHRPNSASAHREIKKVEQKNINIFIATMNRVDTLVNVGDRVSGMEVLMNLLEDKFGQLKKDEKAAVHQRIASIAHDLNWL